MAEAANVHSKPAVGRLKTAAEFIDNHKYWCSLAAVFFALICLLLYTASQGIPFPISFIGSPELFLIIMAVAYFVPFILSFLLFMPFILTAIASYILDCELFEEIYLPKDKIFTSSNLLRFFLTVGLTLTIIPATLFIQVVFMDENLPKWLYPALFIFSTAFSGYLAPRRFCSNDQKETKTNIRIATLLYNFVLFGWELFILQIIFRLCGRHLKWPEWTIHPLYVAVVLGLLLFCYATTFPSTNNAGISKLDKMTALLSIIPTVLFLFIPFNVYSFGVALKTFKLGGGYEVHYYIDAEDKKYFPGDLFATDAVVQKGLLRTKKLKIVLNTKSESYIKTDTATGERIFEIDHKKVLYKEYFNDKR